MISKNQIKYITSLKQKKFRDEYGKFIVEGDKMVQELIHSEFDVEFVFATKEWINTCEFSKISGKTKAIEEIGRKDMERISLLKNPQNVLAVAEMKTAEYNLNDIETKLSLALEDIQDPGNLGTIMRTADWFGIENIFCSNNSVDIYNPKVVQASMGAVFRVKVHYTDLSNFIYHENKSAKLPLYGTFLEGKNIFEEKLPSNGIVVFGNEGAGISETLSESVTNRLHIPSNSQYCESLNIASAVAIVCAEFRRNS